MQKTVLKTVLVAIITTFFLFLTACTQPVLLEEIRDNATSYLIQQPAEQQQPALPEQNVVAERQTTVSTTEQGKEGDSLEQVLGKEVLSEEEKAKLGVADNEIIIKTFVEGELVKLQPKGYDPDNETIMYSYSAPLNERGEWQTKEGDAGSYDVVVTASDGKSNIKKVVRIVILSQNHPPEIAHEEQLKVKEGETITLQPKVTDADNDQITVTYSAPFNDTGEWQVPYDAEKNYKTTITASDGKATTVKQITIVVEEVNRPPVITNLDALKNIKVTEGETVVIDIQATDPDGEVVKITYNSPLTPDGKWKTRVGDAGTYKLDILLSDNQNEVMETVYLEVLSLNNAPTLEPLPDMTVTETDLVEVEVQAADADNDALTITFTAPFDNNGQWQTDYSSEGVYEIIVTVSDGKTIKAEQFSLTVLNKNRPPEFSFE